MRTLDLSEIQSVSGAGAIAAVLATPVAVFMGAAGTALAAAISPIMFYKATYAEDGSFAKGVCAALNHIAIGPQFGYSMVKKAYNW